MSELKLPDATELAVWYGAMEAAGRPQCIWLVPGLIPADRPRQCVLEASRRIMVGERADGCRQTCECIIALCVEHAQHLMRVWKMASESPERKGQMMFRCGSCGSAGGVIVADMPLWV